MQRDVRYRPLWSQNMMGRRIWCNTGTLAMTPHKVPVNLQSCPSIVSQKVQLTYQLFLLENARNTLEQDLRNFTIKAYKEVQGFLNSSCPSSLFSELIKDLDVKCQTVAKFSALLKDLTVELPVCVQPKVKNGVSTNQVQLPGIQGIRMADVLKFGPMLKNALMARSVVKAVQVLGATLSLQQLKNCLTAKPAAVSQCDMISSSLNSTVLTSSASCYSKPEEEQVVFEEKSQADAAIFPPVTSKSCNRSAERPQILVPPLKAGFPEIGNPKPMSSTPLLHWGCVDDVKVQHQKQTSSQLLHFLRAKAKNMGSLEVTVTQWTKSAYSSNLQQPVLPSVIAHSDQTSHVVTDLEEVFAPKTLCEKFEAQAPVFRVKRAESSGALIYSCVIATQTELWDIGEIFTEVVQKGSKPGPLEGEDCQNVTTQGENCNVNIHWKSRTLKCADPEHFNSSDGAKMPTINGFKIPEFQIRRFEETEVVVSHTESPGNFYIQHADSHEKLQALVTDWKGSSSYAEQNTIPDIGTQVMGWFTKQERWCRGQVMKICGVSRDGAETETSIKVEVKRLDYGDTACLSLSNIKELTPEIAVLPLQAVQVSLANVTPVNGRDWSEEAVGWFKAMVHNRTLYARLYPQEAKVTVELFLEKGKLGAMRRGASLSLRLTQNGHAIHSKQKNTSNIKRNTVQLIAQKKASDWEKYLISCYTQSKK
ncbi:uncharacterized protein LOC115787375 [Archocentrus centrarchus]|uniref:uncharacterized protein LOC115787375 n=1 Tax=Archocentrus centrarchus TaxID=63155 RepID=UPI0011E9BAB7|nr:uncharacterized protein LOC115787375 [Archocentrus centrarchus]